MTYFEMKPINEIIIYSLLIISAKLAIPFFHLILNNITFLSFFLKSKDLGLCPSCVQSFNVTKRPNSLNLFFSYLRFPATVSD